MNTKLVHLVGVRHIHSVITVSHVHFVIIVVSPLFIVVVTGLQVHYRFIVDWPPLNLFSRPVLVFTYFVILGRLAQLVIISSPHFKIRAPVKL